MRWSSRWSTVAASHEAHRIAQQAMRADPANEHLVNDGARAAHPESLEHEAALAAAEVGLGRIRRHVGRRDRGDARASEPRLRKRMSRSFTPGSRTSSTAGSGRHSSGASCDDHEDPPTRRARSAAVARSAQCPGAARIRAPACSPRTTHAAALEQYDVARKMRRHAGACRIRSAARAAAASARARAREALGGAGRAQRRRRFDRAARAGARQDALHAHRRHGRSQEVDPPADHRALPQPGNVREIPQEGRRRNPAVRPAGLRQDHAGARRRKRVQRDVSSPSASRKSSPRGSARANATWR